MTFLNRFNLLLLLFFGTGCFGGSRGFFLDETDPTAVCRTESYDVIEVLPDHVLAAQKKALYFIFYCLPNLSDEEKRAMKKMVKKLDPITTQDFNFEGFRLPKDVFHFPEGIRIVILERASVKTTDFHKITVTIKSPDDVLMKGPRGLVSRDEKSGTNSDVDLVMIVPDDLYRQTWKYTNTCNLFQ